MFTTWFEPVSYRTERPLDMMDVFRRRMQDIFDEFEGAAPAPQTATWPRANLYDKGESLVIQAEVPGVAPEDLTISGSQEALTITGERKTKAPEGYTINRQERNAIRFSRTFRFPVRVDTENTAAELKNGILTITVPKAPELKPRAITVKVS